MIGWLRRWLCRCPPVIENTGYTGTGTFEWQPTGGISLDRIEQYRVEGSVAPWPPDLPEQVKPRRHLHAVPDETE